MPQNSCNYFGLRPALRWPSFLFWQRNTMLGLHPRAGHSSAKISSCWVLQISYREGFLGPGVGTVFIRNGFYVTEARKGIFNLSWPNNGTWDGWSSRMHWAALLCLMGPAWMSSRHLTTLGESGTLKTATYMGTAKGIINGVKKNSIECRVSLPALQLTND